MDPRTVGRSDAQVSESNFISQVYMWMSAGLILSAFSALWLVTQPALMRLIFGNTLILIGLVVCEFALVIWLSRGLIKMGDGQATFLFCLFSVINGLTLAGIFVVYTGGSIMTTFAITAGTFFFFSVYGMTTKRDLTSIGYLAMMGLIGVIIASIVNMFLKSTALMWITTFIGIAVFIGLIAYDTQKLKAMHAMGFESAEMKKKIALLGALRLYLDFVNLFILLLRIFGRRR